MLHLFCNKPNHGQALPSFGAKSSLVVEESAGIELAAAATTATATGLIRSLLAEAASEPANALELAAEHLSCLTRRVRLPTQDTGTE